MSKEEVKKKNTTTKKTTKKVTPKKTTKKTAPKKVAEKKVTTKTKKTKKSPIIVQAENHYGKMIGAIILILIALVACYFGYQYKNGDLSFGKYVQTEDEKRFEEEYESLNGTADNDGITNKTIDVIAKNKMKYITLAEADNMLESGSGVIYFGFSSCAWCRNLLPTLLDVVADSELETVYYVNLLDEEGNDLRSKYTLNEKNKPKKEKDASMEYYNILASLSEHLSQYVLYTEKGKAIEVPEKRLSAPTTVAVKDGNIIDVVESTVEMTDASKGAQKAISNQEIEDAEKAYKELIAAYLK